MQSGLWLAFVMASELLHGWLEASQLSVIRCVSGARRMQVAFADTVLLNKADCIDVKQMQVVRPERLISF